MSIAPVQRSSQLMAISTASHTQCLSATTVRFLVRHMPRNPLGQKGWIPIMNYMRETIMSCSLSKKSLDPPQTNSECGFSCLNGSKFLTLQIITSLLFNSVFIFFSENEPHVLLFIWLKSSMIGVSPNCFFRWT